MLNKIAVKCYSMMPVFLRKSIGKATFLKPIRDALLRQNNSYKETFDFIKKSYHNYNVSFNFYGSLQNVAKAKQKGIESTLLKHSIALLRTHKKHNDDCVVVDVGSNFGFLSLVWANSICKNKGQVFAFEPNYNVFKTFLQSIKSNHLNQTIKPEHFAVGNSNKTIQLFLNNTTSNVLRTNGDAKTTDVKMVTIDAYVEENKLKRCDLVKIDVDGIELEILKGCEKTLFNLKPIFIVETNNEKAIINFFKKYNYKILDMNLDEYQDQDPLPVNIFCISN